MKQFEWTESEQRAEDERQIARATFIKRGMAEENISEDQWQSLPYEEQHQLEKKWRRAEEKGPDYLLEQRLQKLIGKTVKSFEVGQGGNIEIVFEDGAKLSFASWDARDGEPDYDGVEVNIPEEK